MSEELCRLGCRSRSVALVQMPGVDAQGVSGQLSGGVAAARYALAGALVGRVLTRAARARRGRDAALWISRIGRWLSQREPADRVEVLAENVRDCLHFLEDGALTSSVTGVSVWSR